MATHEDEATGRTRADLRTSGGTDVRADTGRRRRPPGWSIAAAALVLLLVAGLLVLLADRDDDGGETAAPAATSAAPSGTEAPFTPPPAPDTPEPTGPTEDVDALPPALPEVPLDETAAVGNGITASIDSVEAVSAEGGEPGDVAGPALRVTVRIDNGTADPVSLDGVAVNAYHGADRVPGSPVSDPTEAPFAGTVQPGASAEGVYLFRVPEVRRDVVVVEVGYQAGAPLLVFTGSAA
ncbi:hypothetical protein [Blastococcus sp. SYSU D00695]